MSNIIIQVVALLPLQEVLSLFNNVEKRFTDENAWVKGLMQLLLAMDRKQHAAAREKIGPDVWAKIVYQTLPLNTNGPYPFIDGKLYGATSIVDWDLVPVPSSTPVRWLSSYPVFPYSLHVKTVPSLCQA